MTRGEIMSTRTDTIARELDGYTRDAATTAESVEHARRAHNDAVARATHVAEVTETDAVADLTAGTHVSGPADCPIPHVRASDCAIDHPHI
jgi:hypothetical protein